ncbi:MAG: phosphatase PAP2 family protein [Legionellaceae bacterium]|nr:phosphatase PAP2 family protein [Legionellaceae bacterium]
MGGFLFLLMMQTYFFLRHPVAAPAVWRENARKSSISRKFPRSMRFVELVWSFDNARNSMPSMHVSVATMVDLTISQAYPNFIFVGWLFPVLIGTSALKIKQHYVVDLVPGAIIGAIAFYIWHWMVG